MICIDLNLKVYDIGGGLMAKWHRSSFDDSLQIPLMATALKGRSICLIGLGFHLFDGVSWPVWLFWPFAEIVTASQWWILARARATSEKKFIAPTATKMFTIQARKTPRCHCSAALLRVSV